jgi:monomeric sarcosine oxidase
VSESSIFDIAVIGAGVFGVWTALHLAKRGQRVLLVEMYAPGHSRSSSGGESRIIRMSYGPDEIYTHWSKQSLAQWKELFAERDQRLFHETGVLWLAPEANAYFAQSLANLKLCGVPHEVIEYEELVPRYPQVSFDGVRRGLFEPDSGVLLARRAVSCAVERAAQIGVILRMTQAFAPRGSAPVQSIETTGGERISAGTFVFACGPWLGKVFPKLLGPRIFPTKQEVFFFGVPPGDHRFALPALPTWFFQNDEVYGMPDLEGRGLKFARDTHGERVDPDTQSRLPSREAAEWASRYVARRFPAMKNAPIVETRVCQYENTSSGDFLIDRHPEFPNVWLVGGGSGHGFKHGPALGAYVAGLVLGQAPAEPRFSLASKATEQARAVH